jgi:hypothetical protein
MMEKNVIFKFINEFIFLKRKEAFVSSMWTLGYYGSVNGGAQYNPH